MKGEFGRQEEQIVVRDGLPVGIAEIDARFVALAGTGLLPFVFRHFFLGVGVGLARSEHTFVGAAGFQFLFPFCAELRLTWRSERRWHELRIAGRWL